MTKNDVAATLDEIGTLLSLNGENDFRTRAYHNAARAVSQLEGDLKQLIADGKLGEVRGIGDAIQLKITTLVQTGKLKYLDDLRKQVPPGLVEMTRIQGLGPKKAKTLHDALGIDSVEKLKAAVESGQVAKVRGFGEKTAQNILAGIQYLGTVGNRVLFAEAYPLGLALLDRLQKLPGVIRAELCGSLRRRRETAKDIDIVLSSYDPRPIMDAFVSFPEVTQVTGHGTTKSSVVATMFLGTNKVVLNADLRVVTDEQFPVAVLHFTGNRDHNIRLRQRAIDRGLILNEYALTREKDGKPLKVKEEADV